MPNSIFYWTVSERVSTALSEELVDCRLCYETSRAWLLRGRKLKKPTVKKTLADLTWEHREPHDNRDGETHVQDPGRYSRKGSPLIDDDDDD